MFTVRQVVVVRSDYRLNEWHERNVMSYKVFQVLVGKLKSRVFYD